MEGSDHFKYTGAQKEVEAKAEKCDKVCNFYRKKINLSSISVKKLKRHFFLGDI